MADKDIALALLQAAVAVAGLVLVYSAFWFLLLCPIFAHGQSFSGQSSGDIFVVPPYRTCFGLDNGQNTCIIAVGNKEVKLSGQWDFLWTAMTVSTLPAAASNAGRSYRVTDGSVSGDCTLGGGTNSVICTSDGNIWATLGSSGGGVSNGAIQG